MIHKCILAFICLHLTVKSACSDGPVVQESFDVKPGGVVHNFELRKGAFRCEFTYAAQGGTNEEWDMELASDGPLHSCTVARPSGHSYLFFQHFKLHVKGAKLKEAEVYGNEDHPLEPEEFEVNHAHNEVSSVEGNFKSQMARVVIYAKRKKSEL